MTSLNEARDALMAQIRSQLGFTVGRVPFEHGGSTPYVQVGLPAVSTTFRGTHGSTGLWGDPEEPGLLFPVRGFLGDALKDEAQIALGTFLNDQDAGSLAAAVEADRTLGGVVDDCVAVSMRAFDVEDGEFSAAGGEVLVRVIARRG